MFTGYEIYDTARNKGFKAKAFDTLQNRKAYWNLSLPHI